jgi:DNA polymerase III sliding clamp (beta) subunit (PCNA family)
VERNGREVTFTSTDRYRLTRVTVTTDDETQGEWAIVVSTADVKRILTLAPRTARGFMALTFTMDGDTLTVTDHDGSSVKVTAVDGEYPRLGGVITPMMDDPKPVESCGFNPKFLADLGKMPGLSHNAALRISFHGDNKPVSVTWSDGQLDYFHILMPVRIA